VSKKPEDEKSTSQQKNRMAKNEFHAKWTREHDKQAEAKKKKD
jgi:hypothetical protein